MRCTRCGKPVDADPPADDSDYVYCADCEDDYAKWYASLYPFGQCQECGGVGFELADGRIVFAHVECECSKWQDPADLYD